VARPNPRPNFVRALCISAAATIPAMRAGRGGADAVQVEADDKGENNAVMAKLRPKNIVPDVQKVLQKAARGKGAGNPNYVTAYQILARLKPARRAQLIAENGRGGKGHRRYWAATSVVAAAAKQVPDVEWEHLDTRGLWFTLDGVKVEAGNRVCGQYRIKP
jgi:hypothetical protein